MNKNINDLYDVWFDHFGERRDVRLQHHALYVSLIEKKVIDADSYIKNWSALMEKDLQNIRNNLERKTNNKKNKTNLHVGIFGFFKRLIFG